MELRGAFRKHLSGGKTSGDAGYNEPEPGIISQAGKPLL
jgi:hypothetical protein